MSFAFHALSEYLLKRELDWRFGFIAADLIRDTYVENRAARYRSEIAVADRPRPKVQVQGRAVVDGAADCFDIVFPKVPDGGFDYIGFTLYVDTANLATDRLLVFIDSGSEWPIRPNGGNVVVQVDDGLDRLFRIGELPYPSP